MLLRCSQLHKLSDQNAAVIIAHAAPDRQTLNFLLVILRTYFDSEAMQIKMNWNIRRKHRQQFVSLWCWNTLAQYHKTIP